MDHTCDLNKLREIFDRGLCSGMSEGNQVCVEAAIALACDGKLTDQPSCVDVVVRDFCIRLNDRDWSSEKVRADGMWDLALAQLGTRGVLDRKKFREKLAELTIRRVLPVALRAVKLEAEAKRCEEEGTLDSARAARQSAQGRKKAADAAAAHAAYAYAAYAYAYAAADAADAADYDAAYAAAYAADAADYAAAYAAAYAADAADYAAADAWEQRQKARAEARDRVYALSAQCAAEAIRFAMPAQEVANAE